MTIGENPYWYSRSSVKFQGHTGKLACEYGLFQDTDLLAFWGLSCGSQLSNPGIRLVYYLYTRCWHSQQGWYDAVPSVHHPSTFFKSNRLPKVLSNLSYVWIQHAQQFWPLMELGSWFCALIFYGLLITEIIYRKQNCDLWRVVAMPTFHKR